MRTAEREPDPEDVLWDAADDYEVRRLREVGWALALAETSGTPREALDILERECGLRT